MVHTRSGKKTLSVEGVAYSAASEEEMDSPRSAKNQGQQVEDDIDPQMYVMFKKMMTRMLAEQAEASTEQKDKGHAAKNVKSIKRQNRHEEVSDESESADDTDKEYETKHEFKRSTQGQGSAYKSKNQSVDDPTQSQLKDMMKMVKDLQARDKGKKVFTSEDFYDGLDGDDNLDNLPRKFIKFDGFGDPKAHLAMFFAECSRFKRDNRALFLCFPRSLEGTAAKWYSEHVNPIELKEFDKVVNMFIERFLFNAEALPTLSHLCGLKQRENEKARDFIHRWRSACNKMRDPISEGHALSLILSNFSQPLKGLISTAPSRTFIELTERAEWLELSMENGFYEGFTFTKNSGQNESKKKTHFTNSVSNNKWNHRKGQNRDFCYGAGGSNRNDQKGKPIPQFSKPLEQGPKPREKVKHEGWSYDRKFTPLDQSLETVLEYMLTKEMVKLPRLADPPVPMGKFKDQFCKFHRTVGHNTENCFVLKNIVQDLIDKNLLIEGAEDENIDILKEPFPRHSTVVITEQSFQPQEHIRPCSEKDMQAQHRVLVLQQAQSKAQKMDLISAFGKMKVSDKPAGVSPEVARRMPWLPKHFVKSAPKKSETSAPKPITALSNVSILDLTQASTKHQQVLNDLLQKIKVKPSITPEDMAHIVNQAMTNAPVIFSDEDLPKPHVFHNNALYVVVRTRGMTVPHVLIDGGSSLNICPEMTAKALGIKEEEYIPDPITIYGFDNHGQTAKGKIFLEIFIDYSVHSILFHVVNVPPTYNLLLGRPWIHNTNAVPSTLHQCIKWSKGGMITTVLGEDPEQRLAQPMIPRPSFTTDIPSIRGIEEVSLEENSGIIQMTEQPEHTVAATRWGGPQFFKIGGRIDYSTLKGHPLFSQFMKAKKGFDLLVKHGYQPFQGLGKNEDGRLEPVIPQHCPKRAGLGFNGRRSQKGTVFVKGTH